MNQGGDFYDAFLSHAVEDKTSIANDLYARLTAAGVKVWYSGTHLEHGKSIEESIRASITKSKYGIVILSKFFLEGMWTLKEYYTMEQLESEGRIIILPILYGVTPEEIALVDLKMADRFAIPFSKGMDHVVEKLLQVIGARESVEENHKD